jgi:hypothetical protein
VAGVEVRFTKGAGRRYTMTVTGAAGAELAPRQGPGYDDFLPHDAVHFLIEAELGLTGALFGQVAAGRGLLFWPSDPDERRRRTRRESRRRPAEPERAQMALSEDLAAVVPALWAARTGRRAGPVPAVPDGLPAGSVDRVVNRLDEFAGRWHALAPGEGITLRWPHG